MSNFNFLVGTVINTGDGTREISLFTDFCSAVDFLESRRNCVLTEYALVHVTCSC